MLFDSVWMNVTAVSILSALIYMISIAPLFLRKRMKLEFVLLRGLLIVSIIAAVAYVSFSGYGEEVNVSPLISWRNIGEYGYKAIWLQLANFGLPFFIVGMLFPVSFREYFRFRRMTIVAISSALLLGAVRFAMGSFNIDELIYAFIGILAGFSFTTLLAWIFVKVEFFSAIPFKKHTHIIGVCFLMATYSLFILALLLNNGRDFVPLKMPVPEQELPQELALDIQLGDQSTRVMTYKAQSMDVLEEANRIGALLGMSGSASYIEDKDSKEKAEPTGTQNSPETSDSEEKRLRAELIDGEKTLETNKTGMWKYNDNAAITTPGDTPSDEQCSEIARNFIASGPSPGYSVASSTVKVIAEGDSESPTLKEVYITGQYGEYQVFDSCEYSIVIGAEGVIASIDKFDSDMAQYKQVKIISAAEAWSKVQQQLQLGEEGEVTHTLYQEASTAKINGANIGYKLEETKGYLQPIWVFFGKAILLNGDSQEFEIFVPAMS